MGQVKEAWVQLCAGTMPVIFLWSVGASFITAARFGIQPRSGTELLQHADRQEVQNKAASPVR